MPDFWMWEEKKRPQGGDILELFFLDTIKTTFWIEKLS